MTKQSRRSSTDIWAENVSSSTWSDAVRRTLDVADTLNSASADIDGLTTGTAKGRMRAVAHDIRALSEDARTLTVEFIRICVERDYSYNEIGQWLEIDAGTVRRWYLAVKNHLNSSSS